MTAPANKLASFNLMGWIDDNRHLLKPPMLNRPIWRDRDFIVMILAGPIVRTDYHVDPFEEFFYQLEGDMTLKVIEDGRLREVPIAEGDVLLLPPKLPHSPQRPVPGSIGLVVERTRPDHMPDRFEWYCEGCVTRIHRCEVHVNDFATRRDKLFEDYYGTIADGNCPGCGAPNPKRLVA
jgi:3-hydroxyanthranilate 3,4-dioxygenase